MFFISFALMTSDKLIIAIIILNLNYFEISCMTITDAFLFTLNSVLERTLLFHTVAYNLRRTGV